MNLPEAFKARMKTQLGEEYDTFIEEYALPPVRGLRINTLKISKEDFFKLCPWSIEQASTLNEGFILTEDVPHIGSDPYHIAGLFYIQEPSAMSIIEHSEILPGMKILDLCAAPGGKSCGIASRLEGCGLLVSNEIIPSRAKLLAQNLERSGVVNAVVTNAHPDTVAEALPGYFDRVLVDAPCSGEGMFRKDEQAIKEWSADHVAACAVRQKAILNSAAACVSPGGNLIYSTCTFSYEENEAVIEAFLAEHSDFGLEFTKRYYPHTCCGEGHFAARLFKLSNSNPKSIPRFKLDVDKKSSNILQEFIASTLDSKLDPGAFHMNPRSKRIFYAPMSLPESLNKLNAMSIGVEVGTMINGRLKPSHALFMAMNTRNDSILKAKNQIDLAYASQEIRRFLSGNTLDISSELRGYTLVTVDGFPIGFGKAVDGVLKNHLPKGLNIAFYR